MAKILALSLLLIGMSLNPNLLLTECFSLGVYSRFQEPVFQTLDTKQTVKNYNKTKKNWKRLHIASTIKHMRIA